MRRAGHPGAPRLNRARRRLLGGALALALAPALGATALPAPAAAQGGRLSESQAARFRVTTFAQGLEHPWGGAFLPDGRLLVTERPGRLRLVERDGSLSPPLSGVPAVAAAGQGGLLDIELAPDFATTRELYLCQAVTLRGGNATRLVRARLAGDARSLDAAQPILDATPAQPGNGHYGCRIVFGGDGKLYLSTGDRQSRPERAQALDDLAGKLLRLERDGRPAEGNPFLGREGVRPEIYAYGLRNPQGLAVHPETGRVFEIEMGPRGGDEVNLPEPGANLGWPVVGHGTAYSGAQIHEAPSRPDMQDPLRYWTPAISPSGGTFYTGDAFPAWRGNLFLATLSSAGLLRLTLEGDRITAEEQLLWGQQRLRQVLQGPDGLLYALTDEARGRILRVEPAE
ncbi:PQQ-dependent sugar dehydrogenase [Pseudoroseomonas cervicalis]|uniref:PQQ-dependent sugar dehydrogenase n=1 Tax=Teichococcus cervicalis TaxID=204525 RepID=UPI0022F1DB4C|nr:PQQ-dependent sugar dehydrogenase [Pseudoroseomonas cervicalis]WBV43878.1 PQQ-dependent sugar dehydrogenase [Pseudoroseomonas cervicalis]